MKTKWVLWCSGYHICLTRRRSPVRNRAAPCLFFFFFKKNLVSFLVLATEPLMFSSVDVGSRGVVVITCASHAQGPRFDPGREQFYSLLKARGKEKISLCFSAHLIQLPRGLVVRIRRSHRRGRGSIPRTGTSFSFALPFQIVISLSNML